MRRILVIAAVVASVWVCGLGIASVAFGATPPPAVDAPEPARAGRYCTPTSCAGVPSHPASMAIGFGAAVLAAGWIGRRAPRAP